MQFTSTNKTINVFSVEREDQPGTPRDAKLALPRGSPCQRSDSPMSNGAHSPAANLLNLPLKQQEDPYLTPTNKDSFGETSDSARWGGRNQRALQAPKKRDESFSGCKSRKQRAYDPDNLSIREFRLDGYSDNDTGSTDGSSTSEGGHASGSGRTQAFGDVSAMQANFMSAIMAVEISPNQGLSGNGPLRA